MTPTLTTPIEVEASVEFEVFCANCGAGLCGGSETGVSPRRSMPFLRVDPCEKCLAKEYDRGVESGRLEGREETS